MKKTVLFDRHKKLNAKIVDFAGYMMPISYSSVNEEHIHVRNKVGIFDVSHMGEFEISGLKSLEFEFILNRGGIIRAYDPKSAAEMGPMQATSFEDQERRSFDEAYSPSEGWCRQREIFV